MEASRKQLIACVGTDITSNHELIWSARVFAATANGAVRLRSDGANIGRESWRTSRARTSPSSGTTPYVGTGIAASVLVFIFESSTIDATRVTGKDRESET